MGEPRVRRIAVTGALISVLLAGCGQDPPGSSQTADVTSPGSAGTAGTAAPAATSSPAPSVADSSTASASATAGEDLPTRRPLGMMFTDGGSRFIIDEVTGDVPEGFEGKHIRDVYVYLGENGGEGHVAWLSVVAPTVTKIGPWDPAAASMPGPSDLQPEAPPFDIRAELEKREIPVREWGQIDVDGATAPLVTVEGFLDLCGTPASCRYNTAGRRFYLLIPYANGTLVVEGAVRSEAMEGEQLTPDVMDVVVQELQAWADSIELP